MQVKARLISVIIIISLLNFFHIFICESTAADRNFVIMGYLPAWRVARYNLESAKYLTHLVYFGLMPDKRGYINQSQINRDLQLLRKIKNECSVSLLCAIGGENSGKKFFQISCSDPIRKRFIKNAVSCCRDLFAGIVIDWEYPRNNNEIRAFYSLITNLSKELKGRGLILIVTIPSWLTCSTEFYNIIDYVHLMSYDHKEKHATFHDAVNDVRLQLKAGLEPDKLCLGIPFYGRDVVYSTRVIAYDAIIRKYNLKSHEDFIGTMYFNNKDTILRKARFAVEEGLAGIMVWEVTFDAPEPAKSLLNFLADELLDY